MEVGLHIFGVDEYRGSGLGVDLCADNRRRFSNGFGLDNLNFEVMSDKSCLFLISHLTGVDVLMGASLWPFFEVLRASL